MDQSDGGGNWDDITQVCETDHGDKRGQRTVIICANQ